MELALHHPPSNEIGTAMLADLEQFVAALKHAETTANAVIIYSRQAPGFSAGADLRELYQGALQLNSAERAAGVRTFLKRIHAVMNAIDETPLTTIAAVHGVTFGGGFELALACDLIVTDKMARFCFPELRLGLIPGFGGIPRLKRDLGNAIVRDLLLTGEKHQRFEGAGVWPDQPGSRRKRGAKSGSQHVPYRPPRSIQSPGRRRDATVKPIPHQELQREIDIFCELIEKAGGEVEGLRKFVENTGAHPYLP